MPIFQMERKLEVDHSWASKILKSEFSFLKSSADDVDIDDDDDNNNRTITANNSNTAAATTTTTKQWWRRQQQQQEGYAQQ